jgi:D-alanine--poly(phosphoribitol) ligase subunit 1
MRELFRKISNVLNDAPFAPALITRHGVTNYAELAEIVNYYVYLIENSIIELRQNPVIAVDATKTTKTIALILALWKMGVATLILSPKLGEAAAGAVMISTGVSHFIAANSDGTLQIRNVDPSAGPEQTLAPESVILTTSGSTGVPKAVLLTDTGIARFIDFAGQQFDIKPQRRILSYAPLNFDLSVLEVWAPLALGATSVLVEDADSTDVKKLVSLVEDTAPDVIEGVPLLYRLLLEGGVNLNQSAARDVILTGEAFAPDLRLALAECFPSARFHNVYGSTETNDSFIFSTNAARIQQPEGLPIGKPIDGVMVRLLDDTGQTIPDEVSGTGELYTSTPFQAKGYADPARNVDAFRHFKDEGQTFYRTGDIAFRDDRGEIFLRGRKDHVVKVRGVRTHLGDIEAIMERHPAVSLAVAIALPDQEEGVSVHAIYETVGVPVSALALRKYCAENLPSTAVPRRYHRFQKPLPRLSTGKPDRRAITDLLQKEALSS